MEKINKRDEKPCIRELTLTNGISYPSNAELIMLILGSGTSRVPVEYLAEKVLRVVEASNPPDLIDALLKVQGIGTTKALMLAAAIMLLASLGVFGAISLVK